MFTDEWGPGAEDDVEDADVPGQWLDGLGDVSLADRLRSAVRGPGRPPAFQGTAPLSVIKEYIEQQKRPL
ncbi:hypothetical protein [Streptomyces mirabilis]